jgi:hypothetical protein
MCSDGSDGDDGDSDNDDDGGDDTGVRVQMCLVMADCELQYPCPRLWREIDSYQACGRVFLAPIVDQPLTLSQLQALTPLTVIESLRCRWELRYFGVRWMTVRLS